MLESLEFSEYLFINSIYIAYSGTLVNFGD